MKDRRWQDVTMMILGFWLVLSPFVLQYAALTGIASLNSYVFGLAVVGFAALALYRPQTWEEWVNLVLGIWLILAPLVLGFRDETVSTANHFIVGLLIVIDAMSIMFPRQTRHLT